LSLKPGAYLSHSTAAQLHKLIDHDPTTIYINKEQSPKSSKGSLTQAGIDRAFATKQRTSGYVITHQQIKIVLLSGKHSGRLGVTKIPGSQGEQLELTDLERTLIDVAVRPTQELNYVYPYHQVVGFYLQNAGCPLSELQPLRNSGLQFDFYLEHGMKRTRFDSTWRLHVPEDLPSAG
jgi:hypothetical protein